MVFILKILDQATSPSKFSQFVIVSRPTVLKFHGNSFTTVDIWDGQCQFNVSSDRSHSQHVSFKLQEINIIVHCTEK